MTKEAFCSIRFLTFSFSQDYKDTVHEDSQEPHDHDSAHLYYLLISNYSEIQAQSPNDESLKKLLLVLDKLKSK